KLEYDPSAQGARDTLTLTNGWTIYDAGTCVDDVFTIELTTTLPYTSVALPWVAAGTYTGTIDWDDGTVLVANTYANRGHVYTSPGTYEVKVNGIINGVSFQRFVQAVYVTDI